MSVSCERFRFIYIIFLFLAFTSRLLAEPEERILFHVGPNGNISSLPLTAGSAGTVNDIYSSSRTIIAIAYDDVHKRVFFSWSDTFTAGISFIYLHDLNATETELFSVGGTQYFDALAVDGTTDTVYFFSRAEIQQVIYKWTIGEDSGSTLPKYLDGGLPADFNNFVSLTLASRGTGRIYFTIDGGTSGNLSRLFRYDPSEAAPLVEITPGINNTADQLQFDSSTNRLYMFDRPAGETQIISIDSSENVTNLGEMSYEWTGAEVSYQGLLHRENDTRMILSGTFSSSDDFLDDNILVGIRNDQNKPTVLESGNSDIVSISIQEDCTVSPIDTDGDGIPDCSDFCPLDENNTCEDAVFLRSSDPHFYRHRLGAGQTEKVLSISTVSQRAFQV